MAIKRRARRKRRGSALRKLLITLLVTAVVIAVPMMLMRQLPGFFSFIMSPGAVEDSLAKSPVNVITLPPVETIPPEDSAPQMTPAPAPGSAQEQGEDAWAAQEGADLTEVAAPPREDTAKAGEPEEEVMAPPKATPEAQSTPAPEKKAAQKVKQTPLPKGTKVVYITYDDGPSKNTARVLDTLKQYGVKATFFSIGNMAKENPGLIKRQFDEGHAIGNHTQSHKFAKIYKDKAGFKNGVKQWEKTVEGIIGQPLGYKLFRFPGGSFSKEAKPFRKQIQSMGYTYFDWTVDSKDALWKLATQEKLLSNIKKGSKGKNEVILLLHDATAKTTSADVLPSVIEYFRDNGYEFRTLDQRVDEKGEPMGYISK